MTSAPLPLSGVVLAAGHSRRMGREKALLEVDGQPLWSRQQDVLRAAGVIELFLSVRPEQHWAATARGFDGLLFDAIPDCGPMVGITAGLERMSHGHLAVTAVDLPSMTGAWYQRLAALCAPGVGAVARRGEFFEPLGAIYPRELKWLAWERLAKHEYALQALLRAAEAEGLMRVVELTATDEPLFANWNEPESSARV